MRKLEAKTGKEGLMYIVQCPALGIVAQGETPHIAKKMFQRAMTELSNVTMVITDETDQGFFFEVNDDMKMETTLKHADAS